MAILVTLILTSIGLVGSLVGLIGLGSFVLSSFSAISALSYTGKMLMLPLLSLPLLILALQAWIIVKSIYIIKRWPIFRPQA